MNSGFVPDREALIAALEEMRVWTILMTEHAKFIRLGLDPNPQQEELFRMADQFAIELDKLYSRTIATPPTAPDETLYNLREETIVLVTKLIIFKNELFNALEACMGLGILPAILVDHVRREADRFVGTLEHSKSNQQTRTRERLGLMDGERFAQTVPRLLYHRLPPEQLFTVAIEESMFFSRIHSEHAEHLSMSFRPEVQESYRETAIRFKNDYQNLMLQTKEVENTGTRLRPLLEENKRLSFAFRDYLTRLLDEISLASCIRSSAILPLASRRLALVLCCPMC
ncbi:DUF2935 domain-containing protein [Paenibacillus sp. sptzw28]|uniref:DUF2935 domain-containing protein n=1 Tax=Paenibacillus sp. sptzw28 TaxID=715179 RepID=UPI001C6E61E2|nr:DUF2935 domain-containing protein [Paenibacillus sp. sptzw28]QYR23732.1 DUF2935 domain-containing protein [Paenibacillus sp. sptzw28]